MIKIYERFEDNIAPQSINSIVYYHLKYIMDDTANSFLMDFTKNKMFCNSVLFSRNFNFSKITPNYCYIFPWSLEDGVCKFNNPIYCTTTKTDLRKHV